MNPFFIDLLNNAEKLSIIKDAEHIISIRDLRNQIAHEYIPEAITELVPELMQYIQFLTENISETKKFLQNRNWL